MSTSSKVALRWVLAWIVGLGGAFATQPSDAVGADEPRDELEVLLQASGETRTYEDQTGAQVWAVSDGWDLDQYLYRAASPLNFAIDISRDFGPVDADGHPALGNTLFGLSGRITVRAFDVDDDAPVGPEVDILYVNGTEVGALSGADNQWSINTFEFPLELLRLPTTANPQGRNDFEVDIDTTNNGWAVEVDWAEVRLIEDFIPLGLVHGWEPGERLADVRTYFDVNTTLNADEIVAPLHTTTNLESGAGEIDPSIKVLMADTGAHHVNLIAHSYGGLVARLYAWDHPSAVDKLVLVGTPNGGSELADAVCLVNDAGPWGSIIWAGQLFDDQFGVCGGPEDALFQLQTDYVRNVFNANVRDRNGTEYWVLSGDMPDEDRFFGIDSFPGADDGVVTLDSSQYLLMGRPDHPGKHRNLGTLPLEHGMLIEDGSDAMPLSACELYDRQCAVQSAAQLQAQGTAEASDQVIGDFGGVQVPAGGTAVIDLQFESVEEATVVVISDHLDAISATLAGATFEPSKLLETDVLAAALTAPSDGQLQLTNTGTELASVVALVGVPSGRSLAVAASSNLVGPNSPVDLTVTLSETGSGETLTAEVQSPSGSIIPVTLAPTGTGTWGGTFTPSESGAYMVTAWVEGSRPRFDSAMFSVTSGQAQLTGAFSEGTDGADDGIADALVVAPEVTTPVAGGYRLSADLADASGAIIASAGTAANLAAGSSTVELAFSGRSIFNSGTSGPYRIVNVVLSRNEPGMALEDQVDELGSTAAYDYRSFDHFPIAFDLDGFTDEGVDANGDGVIDELRVLGSVAVEESGTYAVNARLLAPDRTELVEFQTTTSMSAGINPFTLVFDGEQIGNSGKDGPYTVADLSVYPLASADTLGYLVAAHSTMAYTAAQFGSLPDTTQPTSAAGPLDDVYTTASVDVPYTASDEASGVASVELWARHRRNEVKPWSEWALTATASSSPIAYAFAPGDGNYEFYTIAIDIAGNREGPPAAADVATRRDAVDDPPDFAVTLSASRTEDCQQNCPTGGGGGSSTVSLTGDGNAVDDRSSVGSVSWRIFGVNSDGSTKRLTNFASAIPGDGAFDERLEGFSFSDSRRDSGHVAYDVEIKVTAGGLTTTRSVRVAIVDSGGGSSSSVPPPPP